jgi:hypothetical protein
LFATGKTALQHDMLSGIYMRRNINENELSLAIRKI